MCTVLCWVLWGEPCYGFLFVSYHGLVYSTSVSGEDVGQILELFRITTWPGGLIPAPMTVGAPADAGADPYRLVDGRIEWGHNAYTRRFPIPPELYLRDFRDVDLADPEAILGFYNRFGALGCWHREGEAYPWRFVDRLTELVASAPPDVRGPVPGGVRCFEHVEEFRAAATFIRNLTTAYTAPQRGREHRANGVGAARLDAHVMAL